MKNYCVILTGTDPKSKKGGIGFAMPAYISALESANIPFISIPTYAPSSYFGKYLLFLSALPKIFRSVRHIIKEGNVCILYSHTGSGSSLFREAIVTLLARFAGAKIVVQIHSSQTIGYLKSPVKRILFYLALIGAHQIFVLTPWWKRTYVEMGVNKSIFVIPNPMPMAWEKKACEADSSSTTSDALEVLVMTRIVRGKGVDLVVEGSPYFDDSVKVSIAGTGELLNTLKARVVHLNQERKVKFYGWVAGVHKQELIQAADVFCHPTQLDAMPMNILEAMANGLPVVALDWGPITDLVPDQKVGILVDDADPKKIANAIKVLEDTKLRRKMGQEAKLWVLENYTSQKIGIRLHEAFTGMISQ